jgi:hypothetical protein
MPDQQTLTLPAFVLRKQHLIQAMGCYWRKGSDYINKLPVKESDKTVQPPLQLKDIHLPAWAMHCGINSVLLVPVEACTEENGDWTTVDWWTACFLYLEAWHERVYEQINGSIHSYSFRLKNWDQRAWNHAWVNRIAMFLRAWASHKEQQEEIQLFGESDQAELLMTHDVDAVSKTNVIRLKQFAFNIFNVLRSVKSLQWKMIMSRLKQACSFLFSTTNWWKLPEVLEIEQAAGINSQFNFYADTRSKTLKRWLFDPSYDVREKKVSNFIQLAVDMGSIIGLHPAYDSWNDELLIRTQREWLSEQINHPVFGCRQHWLRFAWGSTWSAQEKAGLCCDTTLMFNDRPGFRISAVLQYKPWDQNKNKTYEIYSLPTIIMDSHLYDYQSLNDADRELELEKWIKEVRLVRGKAAVLWHPHTLSEDYGWRNGFIYLVNLIK